MNVTYMFSADHLMGVSEYSVEDMRVLEDLHMSAAVSITTAGVPAQRTLSTSLRQNSIVDIDLTPHIDIENSNGKIWWVSIPIRFSRPINVTNYGMGLGVLYNNNEAVVSCVPDEETWISITDMDLFTRYFFAIDVVNRQILRRMDGYTYPPLPIPEGTEINTFKLRFSLTTNANTYFYFPYMTVGVTESDTLPKDVDVQRLSSLVSTLPDTWGNSSDTLTPTEVLNRPVQTTTEVTPHLISDATGEPMSFSLVPAGDVGAPILAWGYRGIASRDGGGVTNMYLMRDDVTDESVPLSLGTLNGGRVVVNTPTTLAELTSLQLSIKTSDQPL